MVAGVVALGAACGGKVTFVEGSGAGSGGDASSSTSNGTTTSSKASTGATTGSGEPTCDDLLAAFEKAVDVAQVCDPKASVLQCDGSFILLDACDCPSLVLNEKNFQAATDAVAAREAWKGAGCPSLECAACFEAQGGTCSPEPGPNGLGVCVGLTLNGE